MRRHSSICGIDGLGVVARVFDDENFTSHGFAGTRRSFVQIDYQGAEFTFANRINDRGGVVGAYVGTNGDYHVHFVTGRGNGRIYTAAPGAKLIAGLRPGDRR